MLTNERKIIQLYARAGFGLSPDKWVEERSKPLQKVIDSLFEKAKRPTLLNGNLEEMDWDEYDRLSEKDKKELKEKALQTTIRLNAQWVEQMATNDNPLLERMTFFWHGHFACQLRNPYLAEQQNNTIRRHALGNFRDLVRAIAQDGGMIRFLNNQQNVKNRPNENFARELMELFTIGRGNYTEQDIKESARAFTGWATNLRGDFVFRRLQHDFGEKTFMGKTGNFDGTDIIDIILEKKETAHFVASKVYRHFIHETVNQSHVQELADVFYQSNYDIETLMRVVFERDWLYEKPNFGTKIKSPIELLVGVLKVFEVQFDSPRPLVFIQKTLGQVLFQPPNVAGWAGGKTWIDNATLMIRLNLPNYLFQTMELDVAEKPEFEALARNVSRKSLDAKVTANRLITTFQRFDEATLLEELKTYLLLPEVAISKQLLDQFSVKTSDADYLKSLAIRLMSLPEYQLC